MKTFNEIEPCLGVLTAAHENILERLEKIEQMTKKCIYKYESSLFKKANPDFGALLTESNTHSVMLQKMVVNTSYKTIGFIDAQTRDMWNWISTCKIMLDIEIDMESDTDIV